MQPYLFPYVGYFQLMSAVEVFVCYDDVQYKKGGWINRNLIALDASPRWITMPVANASLNTLICQRFYVSGDEPVRRILASLEAAYRDFPYYADTIELLTGILSFDDRNVASFNANAICRLKHSLGIECQVLRSSDIPGHQCLTGQARLLELCGLVGADHYINPIGGRSLYDPSAFRAAGIDLSFLECVVPPEPLRTGESYLSIIDTLMRHGATGSREAMGRYRLTHACSVST